MKQEEKDVLKKWEQLIKGKFPNDAEFDNKKDFRTKNFLISVSYFDQNKNNEFVVKIITIKNMTMKDYLSLSEKDRGNVDDKFLQCIVKNIKENDIEIKQIDLFG